MVSLPKAWVWSLVRELKSHKLHGTTKKHYTYLNVTQVKIFKVPESKLQKPTKKFNWSIPVNWEINNIT